jgi:hypothetical protein
VAETVGLGEELVKARLKLAFELVDHSSRTSFRSVFPLASIVTVPSRKALPAVPIEPALAGRGGGGDD